MQEGGPAEGPAVRQGARPFGGVENQLNLAVLDGVDHVRPALQNLVDTGRLDPVLLEISLRAAGRQDLEAELGEHLHRRQDARLVGLAHRQDRKSTRLNSSHANISYAVFCLKKKIGKVLGPRGL